MLLLVLSAVLFYCGSVQKKNTPVMYLWGAPLPRSGGFQDFRSLTMLKANISLQNDDFLHH